MSFHNLPHSFFINYITFYRLSKSFFKKIRAAKSSSYYLFSYRYLLGILRLGKAAAEDRLCPGVTVDRLCSLRAGAYTSGATDATLGVDFEFIKSDRLGRADLRAGAAECALRADRLRKAEGESFGDRIRKLSDNIEGSRRERQLFAVLVRNDRKDKSSDVAEAVGKDLLLFNAIGKGMRERTGHNAAKRYLGKIKKLSCLLRCASDAAGAVSENERGFINEKL